MSQKNKCHPYFNMGTGLTIHFNGDRTFQIPIKVRSRKLISNGIPTISTLEKDTRKPGFYISITYTFFT